MNAFFISDLHFGHKRITDFRCDNGVKYRQGELWEENMNILVDNWNSVVTKRDKVYVLGDVAFNDVGFEALKRLKGTKVMVRGNHDNYYPTSKWLEVFDEVEGLVRYKNYWLSHAPIHPDELRGKLNIHGHNHHKLIIDPITQEPDSRYICVCPEWTNHFPVSLDAIRSGEYQQSVLKLWRSINVKSVS